jgi:hypothetical protein
VKRIVSKRNSEKGEGGVKRREEKKKRRRVQ